MFNLWYDVTKSKDVVDKMKQKNEVISIVEALKELYPDGICSLQYKKDY